MARPTLFDRPLTPAERMRIYRARKAGKSWLPPVPVTQAEIARACRQSLRARYYETAIERHRLIDWPDAIFDGQYGKVGLAFLADVCRHGDAEHQQLICDVIQQEGPGAAREIWRDLTAYAWECSACEWEWNRLAFKPGSPRVCLNCGGTLRPIEPE